MNTDWALSRLRTVLQRRTQHNKYKDLIPCGGEIWGCSAWRRPQGDTLVAFQYLKGAYRKGVEGLFTRACRNRMRKNAFNWKRVDLD